MLNRPHAGRPGESQWSSHGNVPSSKVDSKTGSDQIFFGAAFLLGLRLPCEKGPWSNRVIHALWATQVIATVLISPRVFAIRTRNKPISFCGLIIFGYFIVGSVTALFTFLSVRLKRDGLEPILRKTGRRLSDVVPLILGCALEIICFIYVEYGSQDVLFWVAIFWGVMMKLTRMTFLLIYKDLASTLTREQKGILESLRTIKLNTGALTATKWKIRDEIRVVNSVLGYILLMVYVESFLIVILFLGNVIVGHMVLPKLAFIMISMVQGLALLVLLARQCSNFYDVCLETDQLVLRELPGAKMCPSCHSHLSAVLRFNEAWDTLKLGCFVHSIENFEHQVSRNRFDLCRYRLTVRLRCNPYPKCAQQSLGLRICKVSPNN